MKKLRISGFSLLITSLLFLSCNESVQKPEKKDLGLNPLFSDHMVLQQQEKVAFWGQCTPSEEVKVSGSWGAEASVNADIEGKWNLNLSTPKAGGPYEVTVSTTDSTIVIKDVLIGEVWLASGQSNMEMPLEGFLPNEPIDNYEAEIAAANYPAIRYFDVPRAIAASPESGFVGQWKSTDSETASQFSAAGYFFARELHAELGVPVGVITSTWGGTPVESWMSREKILELDEFKEDLEAIKEENIKVFKDWYSQFPTVQVPSEPEDWSTLDLEDDTYAEKAFNDSSWDTAEQPPIVEQLSTTSKDGVYWFRKKVVLSDVSSDYTFTVSEGIDDMDVTYFNGEQIGHTIGWNTPRKYTIDKGLLTAGDNTIAVRVTDTGGGGGFVGEVRLQNAASGEKIDIAKHWKYKQIAGIQGSSFLLFHKNTDALENPPKNIESFSLDAHTPSVLYNGMIHPLIPYTIKGGIWYQGESNVGRDTQYLKLFPGMIDDWRERWKADFSFYFVQIAPFDYGNGLSPALRDAQRKSLTTKKTGMAITMDIGLPKSIHPGNKQDVGNRLALLALANDYGKKVVPSGPLYKSHAITGNKVIISFDHATANLKSKNSAVTGFEIAEADKKFVPAKAKIVGNTIEAYAPTVTSPEFVRYAWKDFINGSLFNSEDLPASSFTTEE